VNTTQSGEKVGHFELLNLIQQFLVPTAPWMKVVIEPNSGQKFTKLGNHLLRFFFCVEESTADTSNTYNQDRNPAKFFL
jgi:hypothetical protein